VARHEVLKGKVQIYKRPGGRYWQCAASFAGKQYRESTKREDIRQAEDFAEDWFLELRGKHKRGEIGKLEEVDREKTFEQAADVFKREFEVITQGQRNAIYVGGHKRRLDLWIVPFLGKLPLSQVTSGKIQEYRIWRVEQAMAKKGKMPARSTLHQESVVIRQTLKTALRHGWIDHLPDMTEPYRKNEKVVHRAWFSPEEYRRLIEATRRRAAEPPKPRWKWECEQLHDYVLFLANTGLRPDEAGRLEYRDVAIVHDDATGENILEIEVNQGKRGTGYCKSMPGAVLPFERLVGRNKPKPTDRIFSKLYSHFFDRVLKEIDLKFDRLGQRRAAYSLRHTYISFRLIEGADIYQVAKNCRTSVEMIEKHYAAHIKNRLDTAAINVTKARTRKQSSVPIVVGADGTLPTPKEKLKFGNSRMRGKGKSSIATRPDAAAATSSFQQKARRRSSEAGDLE
jgi:integrase